MELVYLSLSLLRSIIRVPALRLIQEILHDPTPEGSMQVHELNARKDKGLSFLLIGFMIGCLGYVVYT